MPVIQSEWSKRQIASLFHPRRRLKEGSMAGSQFTMIRTVIGGLGVVDSQWKGRP